MNDIAIITSYLEGYLDLKQVVSADDYIICTDGGYDIARKQEIQPDLLMGDFDSIQADLPENIAIRRFDPRKDFTDLELALKTAVELGARRVTIIGGIGGRLDHTVANLQLLSHYSDSFEQLIMLDGKNKCFVLNQSQQKHLEIPRETDCYLSLFSLSERCTGVTIEGVKYPLHDHTLTRDFPLGVSNEFQEKSAALSVKDGTLLVVLSHE